jgi:hypothetical protein
MPAIYREPLCPFKVLPSTVSCLCTTSESVTSPSQLIQAHAPDQNPLVASDLTLYDKSLKIVASLYLGDGLSRHYLCNHCVGAWTPTPQCPPGALARFFPEGNGLISNVTDSAHQNVPCNATSTGSCFSRLQSFHYVQAPTLARPPGCTHR